VPGAERDPTAVPGPATGTGATARRPRGGYLLVTAVLAGTTLLLFGLVEWAALPVLTDPVPAMRRAGAWAALTGVGLLTGDVLLPVPSSLVMIAHGAVFGVLPGAVLSLLGGAGATLVGFVLGRRGRGVVARVTTSSQRRRADRLLTRWGVLAVVVSRPVPVLAETVAVLAGTSSMRWYEATGAGVLGSVAPAFLYAAAGASGDAAVGALLLFGLVAGLALAVGAVLTMTRSPGWRRRVPGRRHGRPTVRTPSPRSPAARRGRRSVHPAPGPGRRAPAGPPAG
jgi:uncharacterized membrane protein YdjX (TVP38/TMEM64 family)